MTHPPPVFRFAPSPNGYLHLGHAYSALVTAELATRFGGRFLLRIEDIDVGRSRPEFEEQILDDLAWLGLHWEEPVRRQSEHMDYYATGVAKLQALDVLYPCFATRKEIFEAVQSSETSPYPHDPDGSPLYPELHKKLSTDEIEGRKARGEAFALRLDMPRAIQIGEEIAGSPLCFRSFDKEGTVTSHKIDPARWGDVVIARKDYPTSYHLSVVMDDALQGVTHVTRGQDLLAATDVHRLLQVLLGLPEPLYYHHRLVMDDTGRKLSKSFCDQSLKSLREEGATPADIFHLVGFSGEI